MSIQFIKNIGNIGYVSLRRFCTTGPKTSVDLIQKPFESNQDEPIEMKNPYEKEKSKCILCQMQIELNYKNVRLLSQFQSPYTGRIYGRHITGLCKAQQERVEREIKRSQDSGYMPTYHKWPEYLRDPALFNPEKPSRPHKY